MKRAAPTSGMVGTRARGGRPPVGRDWLDHVEEIAEHVRAGVPIEPACRLVRVPHRTVEEAIYREDPAAEPIIRARAEVEAALLADIRRLGVAGKPIGGPSWLLERLFPKRWKPPPVAVHSGQDPDAAPAQTTEVPATAEQLRARLDALRSRLGEP